MEMGYLTVSQVRLGAKIGDARAKDSNAFRKRLILSTTSIACQMAVVDIVDIFDAFDIFNTSPARSLRN